MEKSRVFAAKADNFLPLKKKRKHYTIVLAPLGIEPNMIKNSRQTPLAQRQDFDILSDRTHNCKQAFYSTKYRLRRSVIVLIINQYACLRKSPLSDAIRSAFFALWKILMVS